MSIPPQAYTRGGPLWYLAWQIARNWPVVLSLVASAGGLCFYVRVRICGDRGFFSYGSAHLHKDLCRKGLCNTTIWEHSI